MADDETVTTTRRYGEQTLADFEAQQQSAATEIPTQPVVVEKDVKRINWRAVGKTLLIAAVAIAAVALAFTVAAPVTAWLVTQISAIPYIGPAFAWAANGLATVVGSIGGGIAGLGHVLGIGHAATAVAAAGHAGGLSLASAQTIGHGAAYVAAGATGVAALPIVSKQLIGSTYVTHAHTVSVVNQPDSNLLFAKKAALMDTPDATEIGAAAHTHSASLAAKMGHESTGHERPSWVQRAAAKSAFQHTLNGGGSYTDAVLAAQAVTTPELRNSSYVEQLNADRAALDAALSQPKR